MASWVQERISTTATTAEFGQFACGRGSSLRAASWQADILGGSANGDGYRGRLQVRKAGA